MKARGIDADRAADIAKWFADQTGGKPSDADLRNFRGDIGRGVFDRWSPPAPAAA